MPYHQLVLELPGRELARAEEACTRLGAIAVSLADAGDEPLLEPAPGETPVWQAVRLRALFEVSVNPDGRGRDAGGRAGTAGRRHRRRARRGPRLGARMAQGLPADALRPAPVGCAGGPAARTGPPRSSSSSIRALRSAPARMRRRRSASNGWTGGSGAVSASWTTAAARESSRSPRSSSAPRRPRPSTSTRRPSRRRAKTRRRTGSRPQVDVVERAGSGRRRLRHRPRQHPGGAAGRACAAPRAACARAGGEIVLAGMLDAPGRGGSAGLWAVV